jgi:periplasmic protein CpxP/Spy
MKKAIFATLLSSTLCLSIPATLAALPADDAAAPAAAHSMPTPEQVVSKMTSKLSLTPDQAAKITPIVADRQQKLKAIAADTTASHADRKTQAKAAYGDSDAQIKAILTPDQQAKYAAMETQMRAKATKHAATTE